MRPSFTAFLLLTLLAPGQSRSDDWPQYRGPGREGVWPQPVFADAGAVNYVWPAFADGTIFVRNQEEMVTVESQTNIPLQ